MKESFDQESGDQEAQKEQLCVNIIKCYFRGNFCSKFVLKSCFVVSLRKAIESCAYCNMFTDRPYVEASVVSTGLKSNYKGACSSDLCFLWQFSDMDHIWSQLNTHVLKSHFPSLPIYLHLRFRC